MTFNWFIQAYIYAKTTLNALCWFFSVLFSTLFYAYESFSIVYRLYTVRFSARYYFDSRNSREQDCIRHVKHVLLLQVRVWLKETSLGASTAANVIDNKDGSYSAIFIAFWAGQPKVMAAIISPRQVTATAFKRRSILYFIIFSTWICHSRLFWNISFPWGQSREFVMRFHFI